MPQFQYRAIDRDSRVSNGVLAAESESLLQQRMEKLDLFLIEARPISARSNTETKVSVKRKVLVDFFGGFATLLSAGIDASESLKVLSQEMEDAGFRLVLENLRLNIESGVSLSEAMSGYEELFSSEICNLIRAGEYSGQLVETCDDIGHHLEWLDNLMGDVKQATIYPTMIFFAVLALIFLMFSFVVPQFATIFDSLDLELPLLTRGVIATGEFVSSYWFVFPILIAAITMLLRTGPGLWPAFGVGLDRLKLNLPVFGPVIQLLVLSRFTHNLALMLKAGIPIVEALRLIRPVVGNRVMAIAITDAELAVTSGRKMSDALTSHDGVVSPLVMRMIVVGEETGNLDDCLQKISDRMDLEIPRRIKTLFSVLEPLIIVFLIGVVGLVAGSIFLPMFSLMSGIGA